MPIALLELRVLYKE